MGHVDRVDKDMRSFDTDRIDAKRLTKVNETVVSNLDKNIDKQRNEALGVIIWLQ